MRVSTNAIYRTGIEAIQRGQSELARTQLQMSSGKRILTPSDDPNGAVQALQLRQRIAANEQFSRNANYATTRLQQEETVLQQMGGALQRVRELTVQAANATQTDESRRAIAVELRQIRVSLVDMANSRDANGEYLFAGYRSTNRPFINDAGGAIDYLGDTGQRFLALSPDQQVAVGDSGDAFMTVPRGNGVFVVSPDAANTGAAWVRIAEVVDPTAITAESYTITMTTAAAYEVRDSSSAVVATGSWSAGQAIEFAGRRIVLDGAPAAGDRYDVDPAGTDSLFAMVDDLVGALEAPTFDAASRAQLNNEAGFALQNLDQSYGRLLDLRTRVGARLNTIERQGQIDEERKLLLQTTLSHVEDLDYAEAISRFELQQAALEAAQQAYAEMSRLSLFDFIR
jgi:flagellar hook-associated protein 3 FlgL